MTFDQEFDLTATCMDATFTEWLQSVQALASDKHVDTSGIPSHIWYDPYDRGLSVEEAFAEVIGD